MIPLTPRWSEKIMDAARLVGDPLADQVVEEMFAIGQMDEVNRLLRTLVQNDMLPSEELPATLRNYFETTSSLPTWADLDAVARSQQFFMQHGLLSILILSSYSLPICYAAAKGVKVIHASARFYNDPRLRVLETSQFLLDCLAPGGLDPNGAGVRSAQKVRLMHSAIRTLLLKRGWDTPNLGIPINQEDLVGTLGAFGFYFMDGLRKLNVRFSIQDADDYIHTWNVIGHIMGIDRSLHPQNFDEATYLAGRINERHFSASDEGRVMQEALTGYLQSIIPGTAFDGFAIALTRHFLGEKRADIVHLPRSDWTQFSLKPFLVFNGLLSGANQDVPVLGDLLSHFSKKMIENLLVMERGEGRTDFHIPQTLKDAWKIA